MKITLGLDNADGPQNIRDFVKAGADEFFAGLVPPDWHNRYGWEVSLNRREFGPQNQFTEYDQLKEVISTVHDQKKEIFITLNAHQFSSEQLPVIKDITLSLEKLNPDGYIVVDPALMITMRDWGIQRPLHLSTGSACYNSKTIRYFCETIGIKRVILPRKLSLKEMGRLIKECEDINVEFEAMAIHYRCYFNDEYCFTWHSGGLNSFCNAFALTQKYTIRVFPSGWKKELEKILDNPDSQFERGSLLNDFVRMRLSYPEDIEECNGQEEQPAAKIKGMHPRLAYLSYLICGLCAIKELKKMGVFVLKIPVRGKRYDKKEDIEIMRKVLEHPNPSREFCQSFINSPGFCSGPGRCYYYLESS